MRLFVGQVPMTWSEVQVHEVFRGFGSLREVTVIRDEFGNSRGCAFVMFKDEGCAERAVEALHDKCIPSPGRRLQVRDANAPRVVGLEPVKVYVSNLSAGTTEDDLMELLARFGKIQSASVLRTAWGQSKCCALVEFANRTDASKAMEECDGKILLPGAAVEMSVTWARVNNNNLQNNLNSGIPNKARGPPPPLIIPPAPVFMNAGAPTAQNAGGMPTMYYASPQGQGGQMYYPQQHSPSGAAGSGHQQFYQLSPNGPHGGSQQMVYFPQQDMEEKIDDSRSGMPMYYYTYPYMSTSPTGGPPVGSPFSANQGKSLNRGVSSNSLTSIPSTRDVFSGNHNNPAAVRAMSPTYYEGPPGSNLFVKGFPLDIDETMLYQYFSHFGNILSYKICYDRTTHISRGFGFVSYSTPEEALLAIQEANGQVFGTGVLSVSIKRNEERFTMNKGSNGGGVMMHHQQLGPVPEKAVAAE